MEIRGKIELGVGIAVLAILIGGVVLVKNKEEERRQPITYQTISGVEKVFEPGEHLVVIPIEDPTEKEMLYEKHIGYKPVGICASKYGQTISIYYDGYMVFENIVEVKAPATNVDEKGNCLYETFGEPVNYEVSLNENEYDAYEHIISVPYEIEQGQLQFEYKDGYEIVGVSTTARGKTIGTNSGGCILYTNTEPVRCEDTTKPVFGTPIEKEKVLEK